MPTFETPAPIPATVDINLEDIQVGQAGGQRPKTTGGKVIVDHVIGEADVSGNGDIRIQVDGAAVVKNIGGDITGHRA
jgi:hypothetical protein